VLDDVSLLRQMAGAGEGTGAGTAPLLFTPRDAMRFGRLFDFGAPAQSGRNYAFVAGMMAAFDQVKTPDGETRRTWLDAGMNAPDGVVVSYLLPEAAEGALTLTFRDAAGKEIRVIKSKKPEGDEGPKTEDQGPKTEDQGRTTKDQRPTTEGDTAGDETAAVAAVGESAVAPGESLPPATAEPPADEKEQDDQPKAPARAGLNRFVWDMRGEPAPKITSGEGHKDVDLAAPRVPPGRYRVELTVGETTVGADFGILPDPRAGATQAAYEAQYELLARIHALLGEAHAAINRVRAVRSQVEDWTKRTAKHDAAARIAAAGKTLNARLAAAEERLIQVKAKSSQDTLNFPVMLNAKLSYLAAVVGGAEAAPTAGQQALFEDLSARVGEQLRAIEAALNEDLPAFNTLVREAGIAAVTI
jgi:hypothetical protein